MFRRTSTAPSAKKIPVPTTRKSSQVADVNALSDNDIKAIFDGRTDLDGFVTAGPALEYLWHDVRIKRNRHVRLLRIEYDRLSKKWKLTLLDTVTEEIKRVKRPREATALLDDFGGVLRLPELLAGLRRTTV